LLTVTPPPPLFCHDEGDMAQQGAAAYEGWLTKRSVWLKEWRRRYFRLIDNKLVLRQRSTSPVALLSSSFWLRREPGVH
jgi:hypothetical protein